MAGIYIHVPFCRQACHYCNFHFSVSLRQTSRYLECLLLEIDRQRNFFGGTSGGRPRLDSIYFGGGTPSILKEAELDRVFDRLSRFFSFDSQSEITLEANPDDLDREKLLALKQTQVNRLSIGIQSFHAPDLAYMNRIHDPVQAARAIDNALAAGFDNLTVDLIFGTPTMDDHLWKQNLQQVIDYQIPHLSAYALTVEPKTPLEVKIRRGQMPPVEEERTARQFEIMVETMHRAGYAHYEVSNFARPGHYSRHNLSYWTGQSYLGLGPSAHSYRPGQRWWNVSNTQQYIASVSQGELPRETEILTPAQQFDEYMMTSLRTMWGCALDTVEKNWGRARRELLEKQSAKHIRSGWMAETENHLVLTPGGMLFADRIASDLFWVE
jgi:putative oxygen-independent coproporphyrinogen III oxidase